MKLSRIMDNQEIIESYQSDKSCKEIAVYYGCTSQYISQKLRKLGVQTRRIAGYYTPEKLKELRQQITDLRSKDLTFKEIGKIVGLSHTSVWEHWKNSD